MQLWVFGILITIKVSGNETSGAFAVHENLVPPGSPGPVPHSQTREDEYWYMTEGELMFIVDGKEHIAPKDSFLHIRRGEVHGFVNKSGKYARMLVMYTPGKLQEWFVKVGKRTEGASVNSFPGPEPKQEDFKLASHLSEVYGIRVSPPAERGHEEL